MPIADQPMYRIRTETQLDNEGIKSEKPSEIRNNRIAKIELNYLWISVSLPQIIDVGKTEGNYKSQTGQD